jgi:hypothetical protein
MIFAQIPQLADRLRSERAEEKDRGETGLKPENALPEKETGWRGEKSSPPRYDAPSLVPGRAADQSGSGTQGSTEQSQPNPHGAILSLTDNWIAPGPED